MSVVFRFPSPRPIGLVDFAWSPLFEAALSLRVFATPKRTPLHLPWVRRCRELPDDLQAEMRTLFAPFSGTFVPGVFEVALVGDHATFEDDLDALQALPIRSFAFELSLAYSPVPCTSPGADDASAMDDPAYRDRVLEAARDHDTHELAREIFDDPEALLQRYVSVLQRYWDGAFADEWRRILPRIEADATTGARALVTSGMPALVGALLPEARWDDARTALVVDKVWDGDCDVADRGGLLLVPTVYGWPCVLIDIADPWPTSIVFPLRDLRTPEVPHATDREVVTGFSALGDETRLQIARLVADDPRSTKELAQLLSLSDSAISRHLKILEAAGIVSSRRDGYFVLYRLEPERLDILGRALRSTLGLAGAPSGDLPALPVSVPRAR